MKNKIDDRYQRRAWLQKKLDVNLTTLDWISTFNENLKKKQKSDSEIARFLKALQAYNIYDDSYIVLDF